MASEMTLRIMKRIVETKNGPQSSSQNRSTGTHLFPDEVNSLRSILKAGEKSKVVKTQKKSFSSNKKVQTVEDLAATYGHKSAKSKSCTQNSQERSSSVAKKVSKTSARPKTVEEFAAQYNQTERTPSPKRASSAKKGTRNAMSLSALAKIAKK